MDYFGAVEVVATELGFGGGTGSTEDFVEVGFGENFWKDCVSEVGGGDLVGWC